MDLLACHVPRGGTCSIHDGRGGGGVWRIFGGWKFTPSVFSLGQEMICRIFFLGLKSMHIFWGLHISEQCLSLSLVFYSCIFLGRKFWCQVFFGCKISASCIFFRFAILSSVTPPPLSCILWVPPGVMIPDKKVGRGFILCEKILQDLCSWEEMCTHWKGLLDEVRNI